MLVCIFLVCVVFIITVIYVPCVMLVCYSMSYLCFCRRLSALQGMMEEAHKESLIIKDEKINTLELQLEESKNLTATLHRQLDTMQKEYQAYLDRSVRLTPENIVVTQISLVQDTATRPGLSLICHL